LIASVYENSVFIPGKTLGSYFFEPTASNFFLVLSVIYFFFYLKRFSDADKLLYWIATSFFILATNFGSVMGQNISPANILSPILPNLDHTQRFLPYAIFIFLLLFVKIASTSLRKHMGDLTKFREFAFIISTIILSLRLIYLGGTDHVSDHSLRYEIFRNVIPKSSSFLAIPQNVQGRDWVQQAYINRPMVNSLSTITREKIIREISVSSPTELRRYMQSKNTKFLVMPCNYKVIWETSRYAYHNFEKEFKLESLVIDRGYENGPFEVCLYRIVM
jgi:hypothetical protein